MKNFYGADLIEIPYFSSDWFPFLGIVCAGDVTDKQDQATKSTQCARNAKVAAQLKSQKSGII